MREIGYCFAKISQKISNNNEKLNDFFRRGGVCIGEKCLICSNILTSDSYLIEIKNNVVISTYVKFVTHDYSIKKVIPDKANIFGKIVIGNNCFIGENSTILYGVELADNVIVAAGSVVTKSFLESNIIIGGNPAKKIGTWDKFREKYIPYAVNMRDISELIKTNPEILVKR